MITRGGADQAGDLTDVGEVSARRFPAIKEVLAIKEF